ncbi:MAG: hypothetical protein KC731_07295 [Myxococcales bacterium]|nr:hypothetical protein [Myxococcales bacterium]
MGSRKVIGAALGVGIVAVLAFGACRHEQPVAPASQPPPPPAPVTPSAVTSTPAPSALAADAGIDPAAELALAIERAKSCTEPRAAITNRPEGGTIYNNAMTSADAGSIDRGQLILEAVEAESKAFRCCFDSWLSQHPNEALTMLLVLELESDGTLGEARVAADRSNVDDPVVTGCVTAVAREAKYPASPSGSPTVVEYPFRATLDASTATDEAATGSAGTAAGNLAGAAHSPTPR